MNKCKVCGVEINPRKIYCSNSCKERYRYENTLISKTCIVCGKEFFGKKGKTVCSSECSVRSQRNTVKTCPVCNKSFDARGNGIYCSNVCYRTANSSTKGLIVTDCEVCGNSYKSLITKPTLTCGDICSSMLFPTYINRINKEVFGTTNTKLIRKEIKKRRSY